MVIKKTNSRREPFDREKLEKGIQQALRKRPIAQMQIENMLDEVEEAAMMLGRATHEVTSTQIGEMVLDKLYELDRVAYIRFASVYRNYAGVDEFVAEIETLTELKDRRMIQSGAADGAPSGPESKKPQYKPEKTE